MHIHFPGRLAAVVLTLTLLGGCSSAISLKPTTPAKTAETAQTHGVAAVEVVIAESMPPDRAEMLVKAAAPAELQKAILTSFANNGGLKPDGVTIHAEIHAYRISNWGPSRMGAKVTVTGASGAEVDAFESQSASARGGSTATRTQRLAQDLVQRIVDNT